jgi:hypothetical protein
MSQIQSGNNFEKVGFRVTPIYTLWGRKNIYSRGDLTYGEFVVFENEHPKYYLNCFDKQYELFIQQILKHKGGIYSFLKNRCEELKNGLNMHPHFWGIRLNSKSYIQTLDLEKLPSIFFEHL